METGIDKAKTSTGIKMEAQAERWRFNADYELKVIGKAEKCQEAGEIGGLLRREGLDGSNLSNWRKQRPSGELAGQTKRSIRWRGSAPGWE